MSVLTASSFLLSIGLVAGTSFAAERESDGSARLLVEPALLARADLPTRRIVLDARERKKYEEGRMPGARWVDAAAWAKAFGDGKDAVAWGRRIGDLGIPTDATVIVVDESGGSSATGVSGTCVSSMADGSRTWPRSSRSRPGRRARPSP
jgi:rhodanese-related sulfurtransferase